MEFLQNIVDSTDLPILSAFILGLMLAISPCPLAMNITATAYLSKDISSKKRVLLNGLFYTLGRMFAYVLLASIIYFGASKLHVAQWFQLLNPAWIGAALILIGLLMLDIIKINIPFLSNLTSRISPKQARGNYGNAFLMGVVFALAFCPYGGILFFGVLIPMTIASPEGLLLPSVFAVATGFPVILISFLLAYSVANIGKFYNNIKIFEKWFRYIVSATFIIVGIILIIR